ncbi:hypothetical protein BXO88_15025 [Oribacterium sp. C9]|uniref:prepilin-type N-terminal cleavage/methylation domain-containing protein n=1 Tax=Oribacterium sp. C9 TaxID=1943579 RepID=UPI0009902376|nr:prepilin-type N-terminal cleavage/methylation domain-containing protein [Oribacterium sp. C9]OON84886.1 hypothetical protein BXO88_15025 [Oribacterium sp. C9]
MKYYRHFNKKGFTLIELLIIVVIVGILVAVSVPYFAHELEKTRETADIHTMRAAAALGQQFYYEGVVDKKSAEKAGMQWYDAATKDKSNAFAIYIPDKGIFSKKIYDDTIDDGLKAYGKGSNLDGGIDLIGEDGKWIYDPTIDYRKGVCQVSIFPNGDRKRVEVAWKELKKGKIRPFIGNNTNGKGGHYNEDTYPRLIIYIN